MPEDVAETPSTESGQSRGRGRGRGRSRGRARGRGRGRGRGAAATSIPTSEKPSKATIQRKHSKPKEEKLSPSVETSLKLRPRSQRIAAAKADPTRAAWSRHSSYDKESSSSKAWSLSEKECFLSGLKRYGSSDISRLARELPNRSEEQVKHYVNRLKGMQNVFRKSATSQEPDEHNKLFPKMQESQIIMDRTKTSPIETWIGLTEGKPTVNQIAANQSKSTCGLLPIIFDWIADHEDHPPLANSSHGVDYSAIYKAIASLMRGDVPADLNPASAKKMSDLITEMYGNLWSNMPRFEEEGHKRRLENYTYTAMTIEERDHSWEHLARVSGLNVFNFPKKMFQTSMQEGERTVEGNETSQGAMPSDL